MTIPASSSYITYNGETYNHLDVRKSLEPVPFASTSDTETILQGWDQEGEAILRRLRGMFAFGLLDARRQQFWLVRDRLGIKPLYVFEQGPDTWLFASEVRALVASGRVPRHLNPAAVEAYLAHGAIPAPWTIVRGIRSLLPGECWRFDLNSHADGLRPHRSTYWSLRFAKEAEAPISRQEAAERLRPALLEAVGLRMLSDVPVGVFLSGGIDSSVVVAALAHQGFQLHTFAIAFGESQYNEGAHSRQVARQFATEHTELLLRPRQVLDGLPEAMRAYDQPSIDGINTYFISKVTREANLKVALSGLGGDELFAGYPYFRMMARLDRPLGRLGARLLYSPLRVFSPRSSRTVKLGHVLNGMGNRLAQYVACRQLMPRERRDTLFSWLGDSPLSLPQEIQSVLMGEIEPLDAVNAHSRLELGLYLANMLLRDTDQMSMAHALEVREPLLDHVLAETAAALPGRLKLEPGLGSSTKALLVDALPVALPATITRRPKMGFVFPWESWLRQDLAPLVADVLADGKTLAAAGISAGGTSLLWREFLACRPGVRYTDVLALVHLLSWVKGHRMHLNAEEAPSRPGKPLAAGTGPP
jgi:asparagine synthase (glutamine-hydrolysing)